MKSIKLNLLETAVRYSKYVLLVYIESYLRNTIDNTMSLNITLSNKKVITEAFLEKDINNKPTVKLGVLDPILETEEEKRISDFDLEDLVTIINYLIANDKENVDI